jgi:hypothetical protein
MSSQVCPFSGDVIAVALMRIQATIKTKGLAKSQRFVCIFIV